METKICTKCHKELPIEEFSWRDKAKGLKRSECKVCQSAYMKSRYQRKKQVLESIKIEQTCKKCGDSRGYVLDFHHLDPSVKETSIARMVSNKSNIQDTLKEAEKCVVLCSNCHREFHHFETTTGITIDQYLNPQP